jgi:general secretion pathway protein K
MRASDNSNQDGIAIVAVLWILVLLSLVAAAISLEARSSLWVARNMADYAVARAAADAGIQRAILELAPDSVTSGKTPAFRPDGTNFVWRFAGCRVQLSAEDEKPKIDLNQAPEAQLLDLFESVGLAPDVSQSLAASIADFRDADSFKRPQGAEEAEYRQANLAWGPKNGPFQTVEEVQQVLGMTSEIYRRIAPSLTTFSRKAEVDYLNSLGLEMGYFTIRSEAFGPAGAVFVREAVVKSSNSTPVEILSWQQGASEMGPSVTRSR